LSIAPERVHGFTLDPSVGEFLLSHENMRIPKRGKTYSVNEGNYEKWDANVRSYVDYLKKDDPKSGRPYTSRYIGSLVADLHRNILHGGIFLYPGDKTYPDGKLRLVYECSPLSYIITTREGGASDGRGRILDILPTDIHQRTQLYIGSEDDVREAEEFVQGKRRA